MSRDILAAKDSISRAKGVSRGLGVLVGLLQVGDDAKPKADVQLGDLAELLWTIERDIDGFLDAADRSLEE